MQYYYDFYFWRSFRKKVVATQREVLKIFNIFKILKMFNLGVKFIIINVEDGSLFPSYLVTYLLLISCLFFLVSVCILSLSGIPFMFSQMIVACGLMQVCRNSNQGNELFFFVYRRTHMSVFTYSPALLSMRIRSQF